MPFPDLAHLITLTFDYYGTLIDWETGAIAAVRPLLLRHVIALPVEEIITEFSGYRCGITCGSSTDAAPLPGGL
jgi:hypothetical protein